MADQTQPQLPVEKRPNYFDGQYLQVNDFQEEQQYHIDRQRRPFQYLHVSGVLDGLQVTSGGSNFAITLAPGSAIDTYGQQILLQSTMLLQFKPPLPKNESLITKDLAKDDPAFTFDLQVLKPATGSVNYYLTIAYGEDKTDRQTESGSEQFRRWHERPTIQIADELAVNDLPLAKLMITPNGVTIDTSVCRYSGVKFPNRDGSELTVRSQGSQVQLQGSLYITGNIGIGTGTPRSQLSVVNGAAIGTTYAPTHVAPPNSLIIEGRLGVGTSNPQHALSIQGGAISFHDPTTPQPFAPVGIDYDKTLDTLRFRANIDGTGLHADHLTIQRTTGNVGIGTPTPAAKLDISGTAGMVLRVGQPSDNNNSTARVDLPGDIQLRRWGSDEYAYLQTIDGNKSNSIGLVIRTQKAAPNAIRPTVTDALTIKPDGSLGNLSISGSVNFGATARQMITLWNPGFGIGIQSGTQYFRSNKNFAWYKGGSHSDVELDAGSGVAQMVIKDGNVGIGTASPNARLEIPGIGSGTLLSVGADLGSTADVTLCGNIKLREHGGTGVAYIQAIDPGSNRSIGLKFITQSEGRFQSVATEAMTLDPIGNLRLNKGAIYIQGRSALVFSEGTNADLDPGAFTGIFSPSGRFLLAMMNTGEARVWRIHQSGNTIAWSSGRPG
ncbi:hypothetical protein H6F75_09900 [Nodosilinea sp. FACHB-131]|uniref:hypothetical protein n=1 Tax=Cyanophyceae TaxID=3028117 RepID=UPI001681EC7E|nr:hypothetical protein [Nodosilinea sp. FACHB-131]MBD1873796.1 hypothetical protein [Nodosilinea sp. FACHB-131]